MGQTLEYRARTRPSPCSWEAQSPVGKMDQPLDHVTGGIQSHARREAGWPLISTGSSGEAERMLSV